MALLLYFSLVINNFSGDNLIKINVTDEISMKVPADFRAMTDDEIVAKYFSTRRPVALFTNQGLTIDLGVNQSTTSWKAEDVEIMMSFQKSNIYNLFDEVVMINEGVKEVNGRKVAYFEFESKVNSDSNSFTQKSSIHKYTYIQYMIIGSISWVFNFSSPVQYKHEWQATVSEIMDSIEVKKGKR